MNADGFRYLYGHHFAMNHKLRDTYINTLPQEQFIQEVSYSHGSVRNQVIHIMNIDNAWFSEIQGNFNPDFQDPADEDRKTIRKHWDYVEQLMRDYLADFSDDMVFMKPVAEREDQDLALWQILLHVANHGTDHRAQTLRLLNDLGVKTEGQDFMFYVYENPS